MLLIQFLLTLMLRLMLTTCAMLLCMFECVRSGILYFLIVSSSFGFASRSPSPLAHVKCVNFEMQVYRIAAHTAHCTCHKYNLHSSSDHKFYDFDRGAAPASIYYSS